MRQREFGGHCALRGTDIGERLVFRPWKFFCDRLGRGKAESGHTLEESFQLLRRLIQVSEEILSIIFRFVLLDACAQGFGERAPEGIKADAAHFENSASIARLISVQIKIAFRSIEIFTVSPIEKAQRDKCVKKIRRAARMETEFQAKAFAIERTVSQNGEQAQLGRAQKGL
jgi:hypothetical protein